MRARPTGRLATPPQQMYNLKRLKYPPTKREKLEVPMEGEASRDSADAEYIFNQDSRLLPVDLQHNHHFHFTHVLSARPSRPQFTSAR